MKRIVSIAAALLASAAPLAAQGADERAVLDVVQRLFDGMRTADSVLVRSVFHPDARLISTGMRNGEPAVGVIPIDGFVQAVGGAEAVWDEKIFDPQVRIDGNLAQVWTEYTFHAGERFSHCGVDAFLLARTTDGWKIASLADTRRREGCEALLEKEPWTGGEKPAQASGARGHLFVVGGGRRGPGLMRRFVELAGGPGRASIVVIPMASGSPEETGRALVDEFESLGATARSVVFTRESADREASAALLDDATGVWYSGGSQDRVAPVLTGTRVNDAIVRRYREGAVVGGTSAGAAIMSPLMITGNQYREDSDTAGYYGDEFRAVARGFIELVPGLGYLPGAIVDQHFLRRERHNRLISAVLEHADHVGVGIDESTAVIVRPDGRWEVAGESVAVVYDARGSRVTTATAPALGAVDVRMHVLPAGAIFDPASGRASLTSAASPVATDGR